MDNKLEQMIWENFVSEVCERFGSQIALIEIGTTINRKRWTGYSLTGFFNTWRIAYNEIKIRNITIAGPNVTDFEPLYNIGILAVLKQSKQLPDIHTTNLFSERCTEPERDDHKILGHRLAPLAGFRLVKKAHTLQAIGAYFGVPQFHSPSAFWTLPRIERLLPDSEQKQADYLARYMLLCAVSGSLNSAAWGPLVCHREGLIDDDIRQYPSLERITYYANISENPSTYRIRPAFNAYAAWIKLISNQHYIGQLDTLNQLEVHAFKNNDHELHAVWTTNGSAAALADIYSTTQLAQATFIDRDGNTLSEAPSLATESPLYIQFNQATNINPRAQTIPNLSIHRHIANQQHYDVKHQEWRGIALAKNHSELALLLNALQPESLIIPHQDKVLRKARNAIWTITDPRDSNKKLVIKQPVKMHLHKKWLDRNKPSKALRSWNGASELLRRGIANAQPVAYIEKINDSSLMQNFYICEYEDALCSVRDVFSAFAQGDKAFKGLSPDTLYPALCDYLFNMHNKGVFFRDLSGGNILIIKHTDAISFSLIDTARAHFFNKGTSLSKRLSDLARACNKLDTRGRNEFMSLYMAKLGKNFTLWHQLPFHIYNIKVKLKRYTKRKSWRK